MAMKYKIDIIAALKEAGYNTSRIRKEKIMGEAMLQKIRLQKLCVSFNGSLNSLRLNANVTLGDGSGILLFSKKC